MVIHYNTEWHTSQFPLLQVILQNRNLFSGNGKVYSWGWNEHGNCGIGTEEDVRVPSLVTIHSKYKTKLIGTGAGHSFAIVDS